MEKGKLTEKQQLWHGHVEAQARSGLTMTDFSLRTHPISGFGAHAER